MKEEVSVYLFAGKGEFLKEAELNKIKSKILREDQLSLNYNVFYGKDINVSTIIDSATTLPFLAEKRLIVLKDVDQLTPSDKKLVLSYCKNPAKTTILILVTDSNNLEEVFFRDISKYAKVSFFNPLPEAKIPTWLDKQVSLRDKRIRADAVTVLIENLGNNLKFLDSALENLVLYVGDRKEITCQDVESMVGRSTANTAFELMGEIDKNNFAGALTILSNLFREGQEAPKILGALYWNLRRLLRAKKLRQMGKSKEEIGKNLGISNYFLDRFINQVDSVKIGKIEENIKILLEADINIKTGGLKPQTALEIAAVKLCS